MNIDFPTVQPATRRETECMDHNLATPAFLAGGGEMGALIRAHDWGGSPLGPSSAWSQALRTAVRLMLNTRHPMYIFWGTTNACFYNDAYRASIGPERHPGSLGEPGRVVWAEIWDTIGPQIDQVMLGGPSTWHENQLIPITRHGRVEDVYWTYSYTPIDDETAPGGIGGVLVVCAETTAQVLSARKLAAEREQLAVLFEQAPSFMAMLRGPEHRLEFANPAYLRLVANRHAVGGTFADALPEAIGQGYIDLLDRVFATGEPATGTGATFDVRAGCSNPIERHYVDFVFQPIRDPAGTVTGIFVEGADVTARALADQARRESEEQFRVFAQAVPNQIWVSRADGTLDWFNEQVYAYCGEPRGSLDGKTAWGRIIHPEDLPGATVTWAQSLASGAIYETEFRIRRVDGTYRWFLVRAVPVRAEGGTITRWVGTNTDVDERRRQAGELVRLNETLEEQVEVRTAELMAVEETLRQSQKMEAVGQLTGGIAHDFNNLLTGIAGSLELLQTRIAQGRVTEAGRYVAGAQDAARRAAALTHRLLAFSRRQTLDPRPTDVDRLVRGMEELIRRTLGPAIAIELRTAPNPLWNTLVDSSQLENALLNLCINARDAMPDGGTLVVATENRQFDGSDARTRELPPGQYVSLCVSDTGTGMTPDVVAKAFDPFFTTKPIGMGTGLGLSMTYGFVRQSGGQVDIRSRVGHGTTVCLYLPRHQGEAEPAEPPRAAAAGRHAERGETVLVVDDEPTVRMLVTDVLEDLGYMAIQATDGSEGLAVLRSEARVDLLITDVGLPGGLNGRQIADAARLERPHLKVLFITGYAETAVLGEGRLDPGMHVLTKPFALDALASRIRELLAGS